MTLARTALRLQAVRALLADPVIDGLCQGRVFDSRIGDLDEAEPVPTIVLYTEEDDARAYCANNGGKPFRHECDLVLEIAMTGSEKDKDGTIALGSPVTDSELEAFLDLIEERAVEVLTVGETPEATLLREAVTRRVTRAKSSRFATDQGIRLAVRLVTLTTEIKDEGELDARVIPTGPFALLPEPLRSVADAMPAGYSGRATCELLVGKMTPPSPGHYLTGVDAVYAPQVLTRDQVPSRVTDRSAGRTFAQSFATETP